MGVGMGVGGNGRVCGSGRGATNFNAFVTHISLESAPYVPNKY